MEKYIPTSEDYKKASDVITDEQKDLSSAREEGYNLGKLNALGLKQFNNDIYFSLKETDRIGGIEDKDRWEKERGILLQRTFEAFEKINQSISLPDDEILRCEVRLVPSSEKDKNNMMENVKEGIFKWTEGEHSRKKTKEEIQTEAEEKVGNYNLSFSAYSYPDYFVSKRDTLEHVKPSVYASNAYIFIDGYGSKYGNTESEDDYVKCIVEQLQEGLEKREKPE